MGTTQIQAAPQEGAETSTDYTAGTTRQAPTNSLEGLAMPSLQSQPLSSLVVPPPGAASAILPPHEGEQEILRRLARAQLLAGNGSVT